MKVLNYLAIIIISVSYLNGQTININEYIKNKNRIKYIYGIDSISYRSPTQNYIDRNKKLIKQNNKLFLVQLNDSNIVIKKSEIKIDISYSTVYLNDSIDIANANFMVIGNDSVYRKVIELSNFTFYKDGEFKEYYYNGKLKIRGKFKNGKEVGVWKYYNIEGRNIKRRKF